MCVCELTVIVEPLASWMLLLTKLADGPTRRKKESSGNRSFSGATTKPECGEHDKKHIKSHFVEV